MATLNIKNFPDGLYERLRAMARRDRRSVAQQVIHLIETADSASPKRSILELRGLGADIWEGINVSEYIATERDSWR